MNKRIYESFQRREMEVTEFIAGCGMKYGMDCTCGKDCTCNGCASHCNKPKEINSSVKVFPNSGKRLSVDIPMSSSCCDGDGATENKRYRIGMETEDDRGPMKKRRSQLQHAIPDMEQSQQQLQQQQPQQSQYQGAKRRNRMHRRSGICDSYQESSIQAPSSEVPGFSNNVALQSQQLHNDGTSPGSNIAALMQQQQHQQLMAMQLEAEDKIQQQQQQHLMAMQLEAEDKIIANAVLCRSRNSAPMKGTMNGIDLMQHTVNSNGQMNNAAMIAAMSDGLSGHGVGSGGMPIFGGSNYLDTSNGNTYASSFSVTKQHPHQHQHQHQHQYQHQHHQQPILPSNNGGQCRITRNHSLTSLMSNPYSLPGNEGGMSPGVGSSIGSKKGRTMSGLSALSIDWENMEDFDVNVDHSSHINSGGVPDNKTFVNTQSSEILAVSRLNYITFPF